MESGTIRSGTRDSCWVGQHGRTRAGVTTLGDTVGVRTICEPVAVVVSGVETLLHTHASRHIVLAVTSAREQPALKPQRFARSSAKLAFIAGFSGVQAPVSARRRSARASRSRQSSGGAPRPTSTRFGGGRRSVASRAGIAGAPACERARSWSEHSDPNPQELSSSKVNGRRHCGGRAGSGARFRIRPNRDGSFACARSESNGLGVRRPSPIRLSTTVRAIQPDVTIPGGASASCSRDPP